MYYILYLLVLLPLVIVAATRRRRRARNSKFVAIPFETTVTLADLTDNTVVLSELFSAALAEDLFVISVDASWAMFDHTAGEGPIGVGFTHNDLSVTEVAEALVAEVTDPSDIIARERAARPVRRTGQFPG